MLVLELSVAAMGVAVVVHQLLDHYYHRKLEEIALKYALSKRPPNPAYNLHMDSNEENEYDLLRRYPYTNYVCGKCKIRKAKNMFVFQCKHYICSSCLYEDVTKIIDTTKETICYNCKVQYAVERSVHYPDVIRIRRMFTKEDFCSFKHSKTNRYNKNCDKCGCGPLPLKKAQCDHWICESCIRNAFALHELSFLDPACPICKKNLRTENEPYKFLESIVNFI